MPINARKIFLDACCTMISININNIMEYNNVNCTLNRVKQAHDVSSFARYQVLPINADRDGRCISRSNYC